MRFGYLANRFVLCPSRDELPLEQKRRQIVPTEVGDVEVLVERTYDDNQSPWLFVLKFPGTAGRAERATPHPADQWPQVPTEVWAVNPPGYGRSPGPAALWKLGPAGLGILEALRRTAGQRPIVVVGNSLGAATALHVAAKEPVAGLLIRNPPPLRRLIGRRHGWWNLWLPAMLVARGVPAELDAVDNAAGSSCPAVIVTSSRDEVVPPRFQRPIIDAYAGPKRVLSIVDGRHATLIPEVQHDEYRGHLDWLLQRVLARDPAPTEHSAP